jgi:transposase
MNAFPNDNSVLILDNCAIHKSAYLREMVEAQGIFCQPLSVQPFHATADSILLFLPAYSPDFNPIEESFSAGMRASYSFKPPPH